MFLVCPRALRPAALAPCVGIRRVPLRSADWLLIERVYMDNKPVPAALAKVRRAAGVTRARSSSAAPVPTSPYALSSSMSTLPSYANVSSAFPDKKSDSAPVPRGYRTLFDAQPSCRRDLSPSGGLKAPEEPIRTKNIPAAFVMP